jgi:hypothetical protein
MIKKYLIIQLTVFCISLLAYSGVKAEEPKGAKALFGVDGGSSVMMSVPSEDKPAAHKTSGKKQTVTKKTQSHDVASKDDYTGISYKILLMSDSGQYNIVTKSYNFRTGDRIKLLVRTNRSGYLSVTNIGPTGNYNDLFNEYVSAYTSKEIPLNSVFRFVGDPGVETIQMNLADSSSFKQVYNTNCTPSATLASYRGSKDLVQDEYDSSYSVLSSNSCKADATGSKDIVVESDNGENYGVIPSSYVTNDTALSLEIQLKHR